MFHYEKAWQDVRSRIARAARACGRDPEGVRLLAVSKTFPAEAVRAVHALGQREFGENYVQEGAAKMAGLADLTDIRWHLIGPLQSNKTAVAASSFAWVQTVDRVKIAMRLSAARPAGSAAARRLHPGQRQRRSGRRAASRRRTPSSLGTAVAALPGLRLRGIMGIPEPTTDAGAAPGAIPRAARVLRRVPRRRASPVDTLSMGMSADLEDAIAEGATLVRVGTAIFGAREATRP